MWLTSRISLQPSTLRGYASHVNDYLYPHLGIIPLRDLDIRDLQQMFTVILRGSSASGRPGTAATLKRIHATLRTALNAAVRERLITDNPARYVELPPARRPHAVVWIDAQITHYHQTGIRPAVAIWTAAQTARFLHHIADHRLYAAYHLIALRRLRRGKAAGLRWCDLGAATATAIGIGIKPNSPPWHRRRRVRVHQHLQTSARSRRPVGQLRRTSRHQRAASGPPA
ncbi:N-terminal phage integrase SAM-like domain-containing protein [Actinoallomurus soli]|uniref:N-terminal phage integrase SAM-like domain-containing protein n=1 Tax=Actinoallomurus soli TaxID=2952535 RepID=UPI002093A281|nr:N-terminal phage integrase SAM-like domain-containing protein [Actinoallomurus soli]MCO5974142.1 N-terminal phage integrase SAM-like domain-containing protein [Actinoallomurus soli]